VLLPSEATQIPDILRVASRHCIPLHPISTGHNWGYGSGLPVTSGSCILDLSSLDQIIDFDEELGIVTLEPGVTQGMLEAFLSERNLPFMTPVTGAGPSCSVLANALERGYGITPVTDHFLAVTDMEVVLADGSIYRSALSDLGCSRIARLHKWGLGPYFQGIFTQSGLGVIKSMSIALAKRPDCIRACVFGVKDHDEFSKLIPLFRQVIRTLGAGLGGLNLMNSHRVLSMLSKNPNELDFDCAPLTPAQVIGLEKENLVLPWTGFGSLYGSKRLVNAAQKELRSIIGKRVSRLAFVDQSRTNALGKLARVLPGRLGAAADRSAKKLSSALDLLSGRPNQTTLPLAYWLDSSKLPIGNRSLNPAADGAGLIWYAPLVPMTSRDVDSTINMVITTCQKYRVEPLITLTSLNDRLFDFTVPILFRKDQPGRAEAAQACYLDMVEAGKRFGVYPYRLGAGTMHLVGGQTVWADTLHSKLRSALDPKNILAPGRYTSDKPQ